MKQIHRAVVMLGSRIDPRLLLAILLGLNVAWLVILRAIGVHFQEVAGYPLLDLQNDVRPGDAMTPSRALAQISTYTSEAKTIYWAFFILDNIMPPLVFGAFALVWVYLLRGSQRPLFQRLLGSSVLLVPLGVGAFDWIENLAYLSAIHSYPAADTIPALYAGLIAKWLKAACLMTTFLGTVPLAVDYVARRLRRLPHVQTGAAS